MVLSCGLSRARKETFVIPSSHGPISLLQGGDRITASSSNASKVLDAMIEFQIYDPVVLAGITSLPLRIVEDVKDNLEKGGVLVIPRDEPILV